MLPLTEEEDLSDLHYATVILRMVLNRRGEIVNGELVDLEETPTRRFRYQSGLYQVLGAWLAQQATTPPNDPGAPG